MTLQDKALQVFANGNKSEAFNLLEMLHDQGINYRLFPQVVSMIDPLGVANDWLTEFERDILS